MHPIIEVRWLAHFKRRQYIPSDICRLRISATVALKFIDDPALMQQMPLAVADMTLNLREVIEKQRPLHAP
jgi:hypothetical protein